MKSPTCTILYQKILATIHKSGLYDFIEMAYSQPLPVLLTVHFLRFLAWAPVQYERCDITALRTIYQNRERSASALFFRALFYSTKTLPLSSFELCSIQLKLREALHLFRKALPLSFFKHCYICTKMKSSPCN